MHATQGPSLPLHPVRSPPYAGLDSACGEEVVPDLGAVGKTLHLRSKNDYSTFSLHIVLFRHSYVE